MNQLIIKKYGNALFKLSLETNSEDIVNDNLKLISTFLEDINLTEILISPIIKKDIKLKFLLETIKGEDFLELIIRFINILGNKNRLNLIPNISKYFNNLLDCHKNRYIGILSSEVILKDEEVIILENLIKNSTKSDISLSQERSNNSGFNIFIENLGLEINFSKNKIRNNLIDFITKSFTKII